MDGELDNKIGFAVIMSTVAYEKIDQQTTFTLIAIDILSAVNFRRLTMT